MARHNYLVQRHMSGDNKGNPMVGEFDHWRDNGVWSTAQRKDGFGNVGIATIKEARKALDEARVAFPSYTYRIIQIVS